MNDKIIISFDEYVYYIESYKNKYLFRGQANKDWDLLPSVFRNNKNLENETFNLNKAIIKSTENILTTLFKLQHYGEPTRLLDLTISPLSALFFAIDSSNQEDKDGVVYVLDKSKAYSLESEELSLLSDFLIKKDINSFDNIYSFSEEQVKEILTRDYIIKYDYNFSYTNQRAILQGGTALLFGFEIVGDRLIRKSNRSIENLIIEKIIIPSRYKREIAYNLEKIGYTREILYGTFENESYIDLELENEEFNVYNNFDFYKVVATYKLDSLIFDRDNLIFLMEEIYESLFNKYGYNARIWLYFYFDKNDLVEGNFICRTQWNKIDKYKIIWERNYYLKRLRYMNEQISTEELINKFKPRVKKAIQINKDIENIVSNEIYDVKKLVNKILEYKTEIRKVFIEISNIGKGNYDVEKYAQVAECYIGEVDRLINEISLYESRGESEQFLRYWTEVKLRDCRKSLENLKEEYGKVKLF